MVSLRTLLIVASVFQVTFMAVVVIALALSGGQSAVNPLVDQLLVEIDGRVRVQITAFLDEARQANAINRAAIESGHLALDQDPRWLAHFWRQKDVFPTVSYFTASDAKGQWVGLQVAGGLAWHVTDPGGKNTYALDPQGKPGALLRRVEGYDARSRDWFTLPVRTLKEGWTPIYIWSTPRVLSTTLSEPLLDDSGAFAGVVTTDLTLGQIQSHLQSLDVGSSGRAFLVERDGLLIAASASAPPFSASEGDPRRLAAVDYPDATVARTAAHLARQPGGLAKVTEARTLHIGGGREAERIRVSPFRHGGLDWLLVVVVAEKDFMGSVYTSAWQTLAVCAAVLLLTVIFGVVISRRISEPLILLSREVRLIQGFKLDNTFDVDTTLMEVSRLRDSLVRMQTGLSSFQRFVPSDLVRRILAQGEEATLGGESREVSILFSDLRGYSTLIERQTPERVIEFMNTYFQAMQDVIEAHHGVVLELQGDAILVVFGAPDDLPGHAEAAVRCAVAMRERLEQLNGEVEMELGHRIGVHTGRVVAGNIGGRSFMKYGVIGDVVNVAARLEQLNKDFDTSVLFSDEVISLLPEELREQASDRGEVALKGRAQSQRVYSI